MKIRITAAPKVRQIYWCSFWADTLIPEMGKTRPVVVLSFKNALHGHCLILPISTNPQEGKSEEWAHKLSIKIDGKSDSWVVCNHMYTVSTRRLTPSKPIPRLDEAEFGAILNKVMAWLPKQTSESSP